MSLSQSIAAWGLAAGLVATAHAQVGQQVLDAEAQRVATIAEACRAVVAIFPPQGQGGGSGVLVSPDGYALTNFHVTNGAGAALRCGLSDGRLYDAVIVGIDPVGDVALIKLFGRDDFPTAEWADSDQVNVGDSVFAAGNPFLLAADFQPTVTLGIISGVHRYQYPAGTLLEYADCLQTDAAINPGNSGGPLFDAEGRLIGINGRCSFEKRGRVSVGVGYAISINQIRNFLAALRGGLIVDHATLGATVRSNAEGNVVIDDVVPDSDAARRGLEVGDRVLEFGGRPIQTVNGFKNALGVFPKGWRVPLAYQRKGETLRTFVRLEGVHNGEELLALMEGRGSRDRDPRRRRPGPDGPDAPNRPQGRLAVTDGLPQVVAEHFEPRRGYANYFFNRLERGRVWEGYADRADLSARDGAWTLRGESGPRQPAILRISDNSVGCSLIGGEIDIPVDDDFTSLIEPIGSGGMLAALHLWRRLIVHGPEQFGDMAYGGAMPLAGAGGGLCDTLYGAFGGAEVRFYFEPVAGRLAAIEMFRPDGGDPCEVYFQDYGEVGGQIAPRKIEVRYGDSVYLNLRVDEAEFLSAEGE